MDPWKEYAAWEEGRDAVRQWAALEGKSRTMSDDLHRAHARVRQSKRPIAALSVIAHLGAWLLEIWRVMRSG